MTAVGPPGLRPTWAQVDLTAIRDNCRSLRGLLGRSTRHCAVVKGNAYGHGDVAVARACLEAGVDVLAVALVEEGVGLREAGIDAPVIVLVEAPAEAAATIVRYDLTPSVATRSGAEALSEAAAAAGGRRRVHVCVDTGMHREGVPASGAVDLVLYVAGLRGLELEGVWSHLAVADERDHPATAQQIEAFGDVLTALNRAGVEVPMRHLANSAGAIAHPDSHFDLVRTGIATYGLAPSRWMASRCELRPAMSVHSRVCAVRRVPAGEAVSYGLTYAPEDTATVATVPIGYADGLPRSLSNRGAVLIGGRRRPIAGRVTMDQILVDCGSDDVDIGAEVTVLGRQGGTAVTADEIAEHAGTINYEVVAAIGPRVPRVHVG